MQLDKTTNLSVNEVSGRGSNLNNNAEIQGVEQSRPIAREKTDSIILAAKFLHGERYGTRRRDFHDFCCMNAYQSW